MRVFCSRKIILTLTLTLLYGAARLHEGHSHSKTCSLSLRSVAKWGTKISVSVRVGEEMKNDKLITLKLMLQRRTGSHSVSYCPFWRNK